MCKIVRVKNELGLRGRDVRRKGSGQGGGLNLFGTFVCALCELLYVSPRTETLL